MPETFLPLIPKIKPGVKKIIFNQNGAYSFGPLKTEHDFGSPKDVLDLYKHPDLIYTLYQITFLLQPKASNLK